MKIIMFSKIFAVFIFATIFLPVAVLVTTPTSAQSTQYYPDEAARIYTVFWYLRACSEIVDYINWEFQPRTQQQLRDGYVFYREEGIGSAGNTQTRSGFILRSSGAPVDADGKLDCRDVNRQLVPTLNSIGLEPEDFFVSSGVYLISSDASGYQLVEGSDSERTALMRAEFERRFPGINFTADMTPAMQYYQLIASFTAKCDRGDVAGGRNIPIVQEDGGVRQVAKLVNSEGDRHSVGYGISNNQDNSTNSGGLQDCGRIVENLIATSQAASQETMELVALGAARQTLQTASATSRQSCESDGGSFVWLLCPFLERMDDLISYLDNQVNSLLLTPADYYEDPSISQIWGRFRDIAYILLIPVMLMMVIGTALGFQFLDAYTVKRSLPRMFIAVIFIAISLPLLQFFIGTVNVIGQGTYGFISSVATGGEEPTLAGMFNPTPGQQAGFTAAAITGALTFKIWIGFAGFLAMSVFLAIATIFLLLAFRQLLIVSLIVAAPLAILAWIFPGNEKLWKLWWGSYWKLVLLYPIIMALLAIGRVFTFIVAGVAPGGLVEVVLKLVAYIGPFFLIPTAFKYAGGVFANLAGMTNDKERGVFDKLKKGRQKSIGKGVQDGLAGKSFKGGNESNLRGRFNRGLQGGLMTATGKAGLNPLKSRREVRRSRGSAAREEQQKLMQESDAIKTAMVDDDIARAVMSGGSEQETRDMLQRTGRFNDPRELDEAVAAARRAQQAGSATAVNAAMAVGLASSKTGYDSHSDMYESVIRAAGGDSVLERSLLADVKKASEGVRPDLAAPGYTDSWNALQQVKAGMGMDDASRGRVNGRINAAQRRDALRKTGAHAMLAGKPTQTVQREMDELGNAFDTAMASGNVEEATEVASEIASYRNAMGSASPEARSHVMTMLDHVGVDPSAVSRDSNGNAIGTYSTDEQLGTIINYGMSSKGIAVQDTAELRQEIRTRAGLYDMGGGDRTPEQLRNMPPEDI